MAAEWWEMAIAGVSAPIALGAVIGSGWKAKPACPGTKEGVPLQFNP
jgi:hypothetical protein